MVKNPFTKIRLVLLAGVTFLSNLSFAQTTQVENQILNSYNQYRSRYLQDKLFVHTDKGSYTTGEILWFRLYYLDAVFNQPGTISKLAYVEVLDRDNRPVLQEKVSLKPGEAFGSLVIPVNLASGYYRFRAYTRWMKNFSPDLYFEKPILIINPLQPQSVASKAGAFDIQFFPEGGNLVSQISSKVGFRVTDQFGKGQEFTGTLFNSKGDTILRFHPLKFGMGNFVFTPEAGVNYKAVIQFAQGETVEKNLPQLFSQGYVISLNTEVNGDIKIHETSAGGKNGEDVYLFVQSRNGPGKIWKKQTEQNGAEFILPEKEIGEGLSQFTLFNSSGKPVCERLYFKFPKSNPVVQIDGSSEFGLRKKIDLKLSFADSSIRQAADMSMAVYRIDSLQDESDVDIRYYQWLESETGPVESVAYYFREEEKNRNEAMENLLLTQGWRRYDWKDVFSTLVISFIPEFNGELVDGKVVSPVTAQPVSKRDVYISVPSRRTQFRIANSDSLGRIQFELKDFYASTELIVQTDLREDTLSRIEISNPFSQVYSAYRLPGISPTVGNSETMLYRSIYEQAQRIYHHTSFNQTIIQNLDSNTFYVKPDEKYLLDDYTRFQTMEEVIREYVQGTNVLLRHNKFELYLADKPHAEFFRQEPLILIDGVPYFDTNELFAQDPKKIRRLDLINREYNLGNQTFDGIVNLTTYQGDLQGVQLNPHTTVLDYPGIPAQREFFSPVYETEQQIGSRKPDFRTVLYWVPEIKTGFNNNIPMEFYSSDIPGKYVAVLQGLLENGEPISRSFYFSVKK